MANCNAKFTHIDSSNFGDKRKVTVEMLKAFCGNDEYLLSKLKELEDLTDPESRKRFSPIILDDSKSFGIQEIQVNGQYIHQIDETNRYEKTLNFNSDNSNLTNGGESDAQRKYDDDLIDLDKTTADFITVSDGSGGGDGRVTIPKKRVTVVNKDTACIRRWNSKTHSWTKNWQNNAYWYVGWDKSKNYKKKNSYVKNPFQKGIKSVCRAQTFKAMSSGVLESVSLKLRVHKKTGSPLYVEIRPVVASGKYKGYPHSSKVLTREAMTFKSDTESVQAVKFSKPIQVTKGNTYAIVLRSPLSTYDKCYWIGGWGANCNEDPYIYGSSFLSTNNGYKWIRYGKAERVKYKDGKHAPVDFAFECHIKSTPSVYQTGTWYVYLKPIMCNPIKTIRVQPTGNVSGITNGSFKTQISRNGVDWIDLNEGNDYFADFSNDVYLHPLVFVRFVLSNNNANTTNPPYIGYAHITITSAPPQNAYARTEFYFPEQSGMLPAQIWSKINAPYEAEENISVGVDIIRNTETTEYFSLIEPTLVDLYGSESINDSVEGISYLTEYNDEVGAMSSLVSLNTDEAIRNFLEDNHINKPSNIDISFLDWLKSKQVYVLGDFQTTNADYMGKPYFSTIKLPDSPAYPLIGVRITPNVLVDIITPEEAINYVGTGQTIGDYTIQTTQESLLEFTSQQLVTYFSSGEGGAIADLLQSNGVLIEGVNTDSTQVVSNNSQKSYSEWLDYDVDYDNDELRFYTSADDGVEVHNNLPRGELIVEYNPLFLKGATNEDMPLKMDLWKQDYEITAQTSTIYTVVAPRDNLRKVLVFENTNDELELIEDVNFNVDYLTNKIVLTIPSDYWTDICQPFLDEDENNKIPISVRFTPNLTDGSLGIAYRIDRPAGNTNQCYIRGNYFSTRT